MTPHFLTAGEILEIHRDQIERYGGSLGVRDQGLLESAMAVPRAGMGGRYFHADIYEMAAAYLFHFVKNHPFIDGNKRAGAMAAYTFLRLNNVSLEAPEAEFEEQVLSVAEGKIAKSAVAEFLRRHARPLKKKRAP